MNKENNTKGNVLITGAAGFLGSHLCDKFLHSGYCVIGMDNFLTGSPDNINHLFKNPNFKFIKYNVTNYIYCAEDIDIILHFACPASPIDYLKLPIQTMKVDSLGTLHTLGLAKAKNARYLLASTSEIYGDPEIHPQVEEYWGNVNPIGPRSVYDEAKRFSEALTMAYKRTHDVDARIVRIFNTYGPRMRLNDGRVIPSFVSQALKNEDITIFGDGTQTRSFCFVKDLVEGIYKFSVMDGLKGKVFNLGNPDEYNMKELANIIKELTNSHSKLIHKELPKDDPKKRKPNIEKAKKHLDWYPKCTLKNGLRDTIAFFKAQIVKE